MFKRIKLVIIAFVLIIITITVYFYNNINNVYKTSNNNSTQLVSVYDQNDALYFDKLIASVVKREVDWDTLPITNNFKTKFANDIFGIKKDEVLVDAFYLDGFPYESDNNNRIMFLEIWKDTGEIFRNKIHYRYNEKYELDDMELVEEQMVKDKDGSSIIHDTLYVYGNSDYENRMIIGFLFEPFRQGRYDKFYTSEHFKNKFPEINLKKPIKIDRPYLCLRSIVSNGNGYIVELYDENKYFVYNVEIILDDTGAVDDIVYEYVSEFVGDGNNLEVYHNRLEDYMDNE